MTTHTITKSREPCFALADSGVIFSSGQERIQSAFVSLRMKILCTRWQRNRDSFIVCFSGTNLSRNVYTKNKGILNISDGMNTHWLFKAECQVKLSIFFGTIILL